MDWNRPHDQKQRPLTSIVYDTKNKELDLDMMVGFPPPDPTLAAMHRRVLRDPQYKPKRDPGF